MDDEADADADSMAAMAESIAIQMSCLPMQQRLHILTILIAEEICHLPVSERRNELDFVIHHLPDILDDTEKAMRSVLVQDAKNGL